MSYIEQMTKDEYVFFLKQYKKELSDEIKNVRSDYFWCNNSVDDFVFEHFPKLAEQVEEYKRVSEKIKELEGSE